MPSAPNRRSVLVAVMGIRHVGMGMPRRLVNMRMAVRALGQHAVGVIVMTIVMRVSVLVAQVFVVVRMSMRLGQVQRHAQNHQRTAGRHQPRSAAIT